jgi:Ser/Thr protein kinase RdoA (MazF antagonist)
MDLIDRRGGVAAAALSTDAPCLAPADLRAVARRLYGIDGSVQALAGERDQNCRVEAADGRRFVLKISNPSEPVEVVDFQIAALDHIAQAAPELPVPRVVRTLQGRTRGTVALGGGIEATVRMLSYLEGVQVRETVRTAAQRHAMGTGLARLNRALHGFVHPGAHHDLLWNVSTAHRLSAKLDGIVNAHRRALARNFMARFTKHARIVGIIDFGDMLHAPLVGEVATAAAFHMGGHPDPFGGPSQFVAAYHAVLPLTDLEREIVADLMATRHLITVLISEWRAARYPENRPYIMRHNPAAWEALSDMADLSRAAARDRRLAGL